MIFGGFEKLSLIDFPKKLSAVVYVFKCNFRCFYCHNPELILENLISKQPKINEDKILSFLVNRKNYLEGLCITGGEPLINLEIKEFIKEVKKIGYEIKIDTNGTNPEFLEELTKEKLINYVAMDIKAPFYKYKEITENDLYI
ncbi:MAG: anaerobic ribonucleoside-triphosphate reductase activating protein [Caldisericia bacterium]